MCYRLKESFCKLAYSTIMNLPKCPPSRTLAMWWMMRHWLLAYQQANTSWVTYRTYWQLYYCRPLRMGMDLQWLGSTVVETPFGTYPTPLIVAWAKPELYIQFIQFIRNPGQLPGQLSRTYMKLAIRDNLYERVQFSNMNIHFLSPISQDSYLSEK